MAAARAAPMAVARAAVRAAVRAAARAAPRDLKVESWAGLSVQLRAAARAVRLVYLKAAW